MRPMDIARSRAERASRLTTRPSDNDPRDTASARQNILNLVSAGQSTLSGSSGSTPSLAQFMGGGAQRRTHKVGTGMTDVEREETDKLEREMAATRAKWAAKNGDATEEEEEKPAGKGMSLASLMMGKPAGAKESPVAAKVAQRWQPQSSTESTNDKSADTTPAASLVEAKVVSRSPPTFPSADVKPSSPPPEAKPAAPAPSTTTDFGPRSSPPSSSAANSATLTRLQSSNIVSDRLKWSQSLQQSEVAPRTPASPEKKRGSVTERWGRDEADGSTKVSSAGETRGLGGEEAEVEKREEQPANAEVEVAKVEKVDDEDFPATPVAENVAPKLVHVTRDRARPTKSTPRSAQSSLDQPTTTTPQSITTAPAEASSTSSDTGPAGQKSYSKPSWQGAPISVKDPSKSSPSAPTPDEPAPERRYTRGVALPGMSSSASPAPTASPSFTPRSSRQPSISSFPSTPKAADSQPPPSPGRASVRDFAKRWSQVSQESSAAAKNFEALAAIKASYGVKSTPSRQASMPVEQAVKKVEEPVKSKSVEVRPAEPKQPAPPAEPLQHPAGSIEPPATRPVQTPTQPTRTASPPQQSAPAAKTATPAAPPAQTPLKQSPRPDAPSPANDIVSFLISHKPTPVHLPPGETASLDVFHLNSPTNDPHPIDHNHILHQTEILGIVHRAEPPNWSGDEADLRTNVWVWRGNEAVETKRTRERIERLKEKTGAEPLEVKYRHEPPALAEAFAGQLTICKGPRDAFDHLAKRLFSVRSEDGVVYVEETDLSARSICSGFCSTFSTLGEVFAWLGEGSNELERQACCEFAESIADGRTVTILAEGEETALFWLEVGGTEYASAQYWRYRPHYPGRVSVVYLDSTSRPNFALSPSLELSPMRVSIIDAAPHEIWVVVPSSATERKDDIKLALDATERLSSKWVQRGLPSRTPFHFLSFPSLIPRDLPFLSRQLDFAPLNDSSSPSKVNVYTADEAKETWLA
ncbi:hypothetical protein AAT19DRAFT_14630 [Rhodotorula toruloides]|uniref:Uncharacterized protein n=1 Tax=Rhodotorula toruloides TaxID=5286 RepID=A0A2T0A8D5_RHOTO|nr:hypothetical protein AAT19DRAFT_14630 [Rhodotorula toruloides]